MTAYFIVTNVEYDVPSQTDEVDSSSTIDYISGELGCWIDPEYTKLVQVGEEHSRVPSTGNLTSSILMNALDIC